MKIVTYNLYGLKSRKENVASLLQKHDPEFLCLQETWHPVEELNHNMFKHFETKVHLPTLDKRGEGIGILGYGKNLTPTLPEYLCKYRNATYVKYDDYHIINIHAPWKFYESSFGYNHKSKWFHDLAQWLSGNFNLEEDKIILLGDFNINLDEKCIEDINEDADEPMVGLRPSEHSMMEQLFELGFVDAYEHADDLDRDRVQYTWFDPNEEQDPQRIDYALVSCSLIDDIISCQTLPEFRLRDDASDHVPLMLELVDYPTGVIG
ncbi:exodeoxyribonuclease III [Vibrio phage Va2]|nr:exodeoxyribonuclease III [Vibrio phage Va2]